MGHWLLEMFIGINMNDNATTINIQELNYLLLLDYISILNEESKKLELCKFYSRKEKKKLIHNIQYYSNLIMDLVERREANVKRLVKEDENY